MTGDVLPTVEWKETGGPIISLPHPAWRAFVLDTDCVVFAFRDAKPLIAVRGKPLSRLHADDALLVKYGFGFSGN